VPLDVCDRPGFPLCRAPDSRCCRARASRRNLRRPDPWLRRTDRWSRFRTRHGWYKTRQREPVWTLREFTSVVERVVKRMRFEPAVIGGCAVPQQAVFPFTFSRG